MRHCLPNIYSGGTTLDSGTLALSGAGTLGATTASLTVAGGVLDLGNTTQTVGAVGITGASTIQNGTLNGSSVVVSLPTGISEIDANLGGNGSLSMTGNGTLALNGANTYSGGTTISSGTILAGNVGAFGNGNVTFHGGTLEAGNGNHEIRVNGNYNQDGGTLVLHVTGPTRGGNPGYDYLHVTGTAALGGSLNIVGTSNWIPMGGQTFDFVDAGNVTGGFNSVTTNVASLDVSTNGSGTVTISQASFSTLSGVNLNASQSAVAVYIDRSYQNGSTSPAFQTLVGALNNTTTSGNASSLLPQALDQLTPQKIANFAQTSAFNNATFSTERLDDYFETRRAIRGDFKPSDGQIDASGLTVTDPSMDPGLAQVGSRLHAWHPGVLPHGMITNSEDARQSLLDSSGETYGALPPSPNRWDMFVSGNATFAQGLSQGGLSQFDSTTAGMQIGVDYRVTPNLMVGVLFNYEHTDASLDGIGSQADLDTFEPGVYVSYANKGWFVNGVAAYGFDSMTEDRRVTFGGLNETAHGTPSGRQIVADVDTGYDFHAKRWTFGPEVGVQYVNIDIDNYSESGSSVAGLNVGRQQSDSLRSRVGARVDYAIPIKSGMLTPHLRASWQHEFFDPNTSVGSQLQSVGSGSFTVQVPQSSRDSALIDLGLDADLNGTTCLYFAYLLQVGQSDYFGQSLQGGLRLAF